MKREEYRCTYIGYTRQFCQDNKEQNEYKAKCIRREFSLESSTLIDRLLSFFREVIYESETRVRTRNERKNREDDFDKPNGDIIWFVKFVLFENPCSYDC